MAAAGFTLMEVMVAIGILAISLTAIFSIQASSIQAAGRLKYITVATLLAQSKMIDIEKELTEEGFSDFAEELEGDFEEEGWPDMRWRATISKVIIPMPTGVPGQDAGENTNAYASMMSGYATMITDLISNALRECIVTVEWEEGMATYSIDLATHFIEIGRAASLEATVGGAGQGTGTGIGGSDTSKTGVGSGSNTGTGSNDNPFTSGATRSLGTGSTLGK
jgi:general secretion pathway protein I